MIFEYYKVKVCEKWLESVLWREIKTSNIEYYDILYAADRAILKRDLPKKSEVGEWKIILSTKIIFIK